MNFLALTVDQVLNAGIYVFNKTSGKATIYGCLRNSMRDSIWCQALRKAKGMNGEKRTGLSLLLSNQTLRKFTLARFLLTFWVMFSALWLAYFLGLWFWYISTWFLASSLWAASIYFLASLWGLFLPPILYMMFICSCSTADSRPSWFGLIPNSNLITSKTTTCFNSSQLNDLYLSQEVSNF